MTKLNDLSRAEKRRTDKKRDRLKSRMASRVDRGTAEEKAREMEIAETFSGRQEGRRVKHKFREEKTLE